MSNKKIILTKTKFQNIQQIKTSSSGIFNDPKSQIYYTSKNQNTNKEAIKFKGNAYYRHASQEQFKKYQSAPINGQNITDNIISAQEEYYQKQQNYPSTYHNNYKKSNHTQSPMLNKKIIPNHVNSQKLIGDPHSGRNYLKQTSSTSSMDHNPPRRVSPGSSPHIFKPHLKLKMRQNHPQKLTRDNFKLIKKLGQGKFGKVYLVKETSTGFIMAMKVVQKKKIIQDKILEQFTRELKIQAFLNHPNIIDLYGFFDDQTYFYTLMQVGCDGQLYSLISQHKNLTQQATSFITKNLLQAVNCMHQNKILHRDIKPQNIVLIMGNVKMCDFGWAVNKIKKQELRSTFCGTPLYLSPQILKGYKYDEKVDLWAIGILAYELLFGCSPFDINQQQDLYKILTEQVRFPKNKKVTPQFQQFIRCILNKNPKQRLPSTELLRMHFIRKYQQFQTCQQLCS